MIITSKKFSIREIEIPDCKISPKESWIQYLVEYYQILYPNFIYTDYLRWVKAKVDKELFLIGDYFSDSFYEI